MTEPVVAAANGMRITAHALDRYLERWAEGAERDVARTSLLELVASAAPLRTKTHRGTELWAAGDVRLVVKRDRGVGPIVVTVLPATREDAYASEFDEFLAWWEDHLEYRATIGLPPIADKRESAPVSRPSPSPAAPPAKRSTVAETTRLAHDLFREACADAHLAHKLQEYAGALREDARQRKHRARVLLQSLGKS